MKSTKADWNHTVNKYIYHTKETLVNFVGNGEILKIKGGNG